MEDSSDKNKSGTVTSERGRKGLRSVLYQMAFTMVGTNEEMKALHKYLTKRKDNPLKKKQETYKLELVLGTTRQQLMKAA